MRIFLAISSVNNNKRKKNSIRSNKTRMKKKLSLLVFLVLVVLCGFTQNMGIGANNPDPSAKLDITSSNSGLLVPRMTTGQRNLIASPAKGLLVFDSTNNHFWFYDGSSWNEMADTKNVRFGFNLVRTSTTLTSYNIPFVNNYNLAPASVALVNTTTLQILQQGLYHFGLTGYKHNENSAFVTASSALFNLSITINGKQYQVIAGDKQISAIGSSTSWSYGSNTIGFDVFVPANSLISINAVTTLPSTFTKSDNGHFFGYLISE
jgi:hypothetical protein